MMKDVQLAIAQQGQKLDDSLKRTAQDILACSTTTYEASVADRSVMSDRVGPEANFRTASWLDQFTALRLDSSTAQESSAISGVLSVLSDLDDMRTMPMNGSSIGGGVPVGKQSDWERGHEDYFEANHDDDFEETFALEIVNTALSSESQAFEDADYATASSDLKEALALIAKLPEKLRRTCDSANLQFKLAVCAFYVDDPNVAEIALRSVVGQPSRSKTEALNLCQTGHLLSQVYIKTGRHELAASTSENVCRGRRKILGKDDITCCESLALLSRIYKLKDNAARARVYSNMIPKEVRDQMLKGFSDLHASRKELLRPLRSKNLSFPRVTQ